MTVNITKVKQVFSCNGSLYEFDFSFPIDDSDDLKVQVRDVNGIVTELETITQYEISTDAIDYSNGGTITTVSYVSGTRQVYAWPDGSILTAYRETPLIQGSSYKNNRALDQDVLEDDFDKSCMQIQELDERLSRAIVAPVDEEAESFQLPTKSSRINKYLAFDSDGAPIVSGGIASIPVSSFMKPVVQAAAAAEARTLLDAKGIHDNVKTVIDTYTALTTDETLLCSKAAGFTVTLFTAVGNAGKRLNIINIGTGTITIDGGGDETIGGNYAISLTTQYNAITIQSDGANWQVLSHLLNDIMKRVYPVGSIYTSVTPTNPATLFGFGTWESFGAGRVLVGLDAAQTEFDTVGETGGEKTHTLTENEMPSHLHSTPFLYRNGIGYVVANAWGVDASGSTNTGSTGGGAAHNNLQPYVVVYFFRRVS